MSQYERDGRGHVGDDPARWMKPKAKAKRSYATTVPDGKWAKAVAVATERARAGDWSESTPLDYVALFAVLHESVYGVAPGGFGPPERHRACGLAAVLLKRDFAGDVAGLVEFMRWAWARERKREAERRAKGVTAGWNINFRLMFGGVLVNDYIVERERAKARAKR